MDAQTAFLNDMTRSLFKSFQQLCNLNMQLTQALLQESALAGKQVMSVGSQAELLGAAAWRAQPATDKLRAYHQNLTRLAAATQVELAQVTKKHVQITTRAAHDLAGEVARAAAAQAERGLRAQQETVRQFADPFARAVDGAAAQAQALAGGAQGGNGHRHVKAARTQRSSATKH
jgi:phasin family protein